MEQPPNAAAPTDGLSDSNAGLGDWIDWGGGECPVAMGVRVDVIFRCGMMATNVPALDDTYESESGLVATCWEVIEDSPVGMDIAKWRMTPNIKVTGRPTKTLHTEK